MSTRLRSTAAPDSLERAYAECERLAREHYENFPVASLLIPGELRRDVAAVYAFARIADDYADEDRYAGQDRLALLEDWHQRLLRCAGGADDHPVFIALGHTIETRRLPLHPFEHLLTAFRLDVIRTSYESFEDLLGYCRYSANPVGQLVLLLFDHRDPRLHRMSDDICTALQLTNFWQDVAVDEEKGRCYVPAEDLSRFAVTRKEIAARTMSPAFERLMRFEIERTREIFRRGAGLPRLLGGRLGLEIDLTVRGGMRILERIEEAGCDVFAHRPALSARDWVRVVAGSLKSALVDATPGSTRAGSGARDSQTDGAVQTSEPRFAGNPRTNGVLAPGEHEVRDDLLGGGIRHDHEVVRDVARRSRSNFYYAFFFLTTEQRAAIEAVYSFFRVVDDAVDDARSAEEGRRALESWRRELAACYGEGEPSHPISRSLAVQIDEFELSRESFEEVIRGVEMDLEGRRYETFEELEAYCRRVASAVGHSCIEIFGSRGERSRRYADTLGLAFQLTNILRDLKTDALRGRVYLPAEEMRRFGYTQKDAEDGRAGPAFSALMAFQCARARDLFRRAGEELPPSEAERLLAAEIMRAIYGGVLARIERRPEAVMEGRVRLSRARKITLAAAAYARTRYAS